MRLVKVEFRDDAAAPDRGDQIVLADHPIAVLHEIHQQVEHLRLHGDGFAAAPQLAPTHVKDLIRKGKLHFDRPANAILRR